MKKVSLEEVKELYPDFLFTRRNGKQMSPVLKELLTLEVDEMLLVTESEWREYGYSENSTPATTLSGAMHLLRKKGENIRAKFFKVADGWVIKRAE